MPMKNTKTKRCYKIKKVPDVVDRVVKKVGDMIKRLNSKEDN